MTKIHRTHHPSALSPRPMLAFDNVFRTNFAALPPSLMLSCDSIKTILLISAHHTPMYRWAVCSNRRPFKASVSNGVCHFRALLHFYVSTFTKLNLPDAASRWATDRTQQFPIHNCQHESPIRALLVNHFEWCIILPLSILSFSLSYHALRHLHSGRTIARCDPLLEI